MSAIAYLRLQELHKIAVEARRMLRRRDDAADQWRWDQVLYITEKMLEATPEEDK